MSQRSELSPAETRQSEIAIRAEAELWEGVRSETRRRLLGAVTLGVFYQVAALVVGSFLLSTIAELGDGTTYMVGWSTQQLDLYWTTFVLWAYGSFAGLLIVGYLLVLLMVVGWLPSNIGMLVSSIPWIGSTMRIVFMGEFCQSIYHSINQAKTYQQAFLDASESLHSSNLRRWSKQSAERIAAGYSLSSVLMSSPIQDQPLSAVAAFVSDGKSMEAAQQVWHRATSECHLLAQSRLDRATLVVSTTSLLIAALFAASAMFLSAAFMSEVVRGLFLMNQTFGGLF